MARLSDAQKHEIIEALASFTPAATIIRRFREHHGLTLDHKQVGSYDPTRPYYEGGEKWRAIFDAMRKAHLEDVASVPVAHKGFRLNLLQEMVLEAKQAKNYALAAKLLKQAAQEVGGTLCNERTLKVVDAGAQRPEDMSPEERKAALAEIIRRAIETKKAEQILLVEESGGDAGKSNLAPIKEAGLLQGEYA